MPRRNFTELEAKMGPERLARAKTRAKATLGKMLLREMRRQAGLTQVEVAEALGIRQSSLSRLEAAQDMQISTLRRLVRSLGGELEITARLPQGVVSLSQFASPRSKCDG